MDPVSVSITVGRPREEVFEYLADIANHAEFTDHFLKEWHLTREDSHGRGAGARFRVDAPLQRFSWMGVSFIEVEPPWRIVCAGRGGKFNRIRSLTVWTLEPAAEDTTRVKLTFESEPATPTDHVMEALLGSRGWTRRKYRRALARLRAILEDGKRRGARVTVAGG